MLLSNTEEIQGSKIVKTLGVVRGNSVKAKWFGKDIMAGLRNLVGGELKEYEEMLSEARESAINKMIEDAKKIDADAIVNVRFTTTAISSSAAEILAYGTAVKIK